MAGTIRTIAMQGAEPYSKFSGSVMRSLYITLSRVLLISVCLAVVVAASGCGGGGASAMQNRQRRGSISVSITPGSATVQTGGSQQFIATVTGTTNTAVSWTVNGVVGGNSSLGAVSTSGMYSAPSSIASNQSVNVTATSSVNPAVSKSAVVTITSTPNPSSSVAISLSPQTASVQTGMSLQFTAVVSGTTNTAATWSVNGVVGGNSSTGTISASGLYQAPTAQPTGTISVTATSVADNSKSASVNVSVTAPATTGGGGNDFYVAPGGSDSNSGAAASPWATIQHAASVARAGMTIHVAPGTYAAAVNTTASGTSSARIRYISDVKWGAKIQTIAAYQSWNNTGDYVDIMGFDITGDGSLGILNMGSNVRIIGNHVHNIPAANCTSNGGAGIDNANFSAADDDVISNLVHDIGDPNVPCYSVQGIYHSNLRGHIYNNVSYRNQAWGIHLWHAPRNVVVANNLVFENGEGGIIIGAGDAPGGVVASGMIVVNNMVLNQSSSWGAGIAIYEYGATDATNQYFNNLVFGNTQGITLQSGLTAQNTVQVDPRLVNYKPDGTGDYHLLPGSPAIDAGSSISAPTIDLDGAPRPVGSAYDIGVYEFGSTPAAWPWQ